MIQEHHARSLHWDLRLERDGVLVSWAIPKGLPESPDENRLAVHTEDHPLEYATFEGEIPQGEYGGGRMTIWDRGHYEVEKWSDAEVKFALHGSRAKGDFVLFQTKDRNWMIHRHGPSTRTDPLPTSIKPMLAVAGQLPQTARTGPSRSSGTACGPSSSSKVEGCAYRAGTTSTSARPSRIGGDRRIPGNDHLRAGRRDRRAR